MIYVGQIFDPTRFPSCPKSLKGKLVCHLTCDPGEVETLHKLAVKIGLKKSWFQDRTNYPHYDITFPYREQAIAAGAQEITREQEVELAQKHREAKNP